MRNVIVLLIIIFGSLKSNAQYDVTMGAVFNANSITVGNTSTLEITLANLTPSGLAIPVNGLYVQFYWGLGYSGSTLPTGVVASYFTWTNDNNAGWFGTNHTVIPFALNGDIFAVVTGAATNGQGTLTSYTAQMLVGNDINQFNNNSSTPLVVAAPLPVKLVSFDAITTGCDQVDLSWVTASERISDYFEVQRSIDGRQFVALQKLKSANTSDGASYKFSDTDVSGGTRYSYRLKQVDFDGKFELFNPTSVRTAYCSGLDPSMSVYPNPANGKAFIALEGFEVGDNITLEITNNLGEQVMTVENALVGVPNEILLNTIPAGVYNVRIKGYDQVASKMLIKVN